MGATDVASVAEVAQVNAACYCGQVGVPLCRKCKRGTSAHIGASSEARDNRIQGQR
jgi:hypothetical protein